MCGLCHTNKCPTFLRQLLLLLSSRQSTHSSTQIALEFAKVNNEYGRALVTYKYMIAEEGTSIKLVSWVLPREDMIAEWGTCKRQVFTCIPSVQSTWLKEMRDNRVRVGSAVTEQF